MTLEATLTYLVALAVPVWLLVEHLVSRRRSRPAEPPRRGHSAEPEPEAARAGSAEAPVTGDLRRKAA